MSKINAFVLGKDMEDMLSAVKKEATEYTRAVLAATPGIYGSRGLYKRRQLVTGWQLQFPYHKTNDKPNNTIMDHYCEYNNIGHHIDGYEHGFRNYWRSIPYKNLMPDDEDIADKGAFCREVKALYLNEIRHILMYEFDFFNVRVYGGGYNWYKRYRI